MKLKLFFFTIIVFWQVNAYSDPFFLFSHSKKGNIKNRTLYINKLYEGNERVLEKILKNKRKEQILLNKKIEEKRSLWKRTKHELKEASKFLAEANKHWKNTVENSIFNTRALIIESDDIEKETRNLTGSIGNLCLFKGEISKSKNKKTGELIFTRKWEIVEESFDKLTLYLKNVNDALENATEEYNLNQARYTEILAKSEEAKKLSNFIKNKEEALEQMQRNMEIFKKYGKVLEEEGKSFSKRRYKKKLPVIREDERESDAPFIVKLSAPLPLVKIEPLPLVEINTHPINRETLQKKPIALPLGDEKKVSCVGDILTLETSIETLMTPTCEVVMAERAKAPSVKEMATVRKILTVQKEGNVAEHGEAQTLNDKREALNELTLETLTSDDKAEIASPEAADGDKEVDLLSAIQTFSSKQLSPKQALQRYQAQARLLVFQKLVEIKKEQVHHSHNSSGCFNSTAGRGSTLTNGRGFSSARSQKIFTAENRARWISSPKTLGAESLIDVLRLKKKKRFTSSLAPIIQNKKKILKTIENKKEGKN